MSKEVLKDRKKERVEYFVYIVVSKTVINMDLALSFKLVLLTDESPLDGTLTLRYV